MHLSSVIPANDTRESVFGDRNFSRRERESNLGPLAPENVNCHKIFISDQISDQILLLFYC